MGTTWKNRQCLVLIALAMLLQCVALILIPLLQDSKHTPKPQLKKPSVFITAILRNNEPILDHWTQQVLLLANWLGHDQTFVSIYESESSDQSPMKLADFKDELRRLGIRHSIIIHGEGGQGSEGRRIPKLATLRNLALAPLSKLAEDGWTADRVLFLNDIWFSWKDAVQLLQSNQGDYDAVCSMDFFGEYYDMFATREIDRQWLGSGNYPYFRDTSSRELLQKGSLVPVYSCWGGMAAFQAQPFLKNHLAFRALWPEVANPPLDASECCLIYSNLWAINAHARVFLNPQIKVNAEPYLQPE
ncbi:hypothetical protein DM01DRAFT_1400978 [Hesseltinella vesiculosa]|uniref:Uncharacterized protein n=1 Tax=Hesseltinella vesiculosa TaxID=101127 RepID=A0A1X2GNJ5_9FUNG|nr:hypothetical protein DM01DRAFT_1400978 [Hesseltinella vesiculosa]